MFGTIRKHQTWLWVVIISCTIVAFVIFFSPTQKIQGGREVNYGSISGTPVTVEDYRNALTEVNLRWLFMRGEWPNEAARQAGFDEMRETYQWMFLVQKQKELGIRVGSETAAQFARRMVREFGRDASVTVPTFVKQVLEPRGIKIQDFERYIRNYLGIQELITTFGSSGKLVTPQEARVFFIREHEEVETEALFLSNSNYVSKVALTPEAISQFYSNRLSFYRIPERIKVSYVEFPISNYLAKAEAELAATNLNQMVDMAQSRMGTNLFQGAKTVEESKTKIREVMIREKASVELRRKANEFATPLIELDGAKPEDLQAAATKAGMTIKVTEPFRRDEGPKEFEAGQEFTRAAFALGTNASIAGPLPGRDALYVIALAGTVPSEIPTLDQIRAKVETDYKEFTAMTLVREAGTQFHSKAAAGLTEGKSFAALATEAGLKPVLLPKFSLSTRTLPEVEEHVPLNQFKELAFGTEPGKVSQFQPTRDGGVIVAVKRKLPVEEAQIARELPKFVEQLRMARQNEAFQMWFGRESDRALQNTPIARPDPRQNQGRRTS